MRLRRLTALLVVCAYLLIPLEGFAALAPLLASAPSSAASLPEVASEGRSSHCPCSDQHGSEGCNLGCSCCSCCSYFPPLASGIPYIPTVSALIMPEPALRFPQVYRSIFVPPQNRS